MSAKWNTIEMKYDLKNMCYFHFHFQRFLCVSFRSVRRRSHHHCRHFEYLLWFGRFFYRFSVFWLIQNLFRILSVTKMLGYWITHTATHSHFSFCWFSIFFSFFSISLSTNQRLKRTKHLFASRSVQNRTKERRRREREENKLKRIR